MALTENAKQMIEDSGNWTMTEITQDLTEFIIEKFPQLTKPEARKVLARALASNIVRNEIHQMVHWIMTKESIEE